jgi:hypothetical protein
MLTYMRDLLSKLTFKRVLVILFLAAFAKEEAAALVWTLVLLWHLCTEPALQGLASSALGLAGEVVLILGVAHLAVRARPTRPEIAGPTDLPPGSWDEAAPLDPATPDDSAGRGGPGPGIWPEEGDRDAHRH